MKLNTAWVSSRLSSTLFAMRCDSRGARSSGDSTATS
ncbi:Uncharacterised protein [Bordetella pertussis]|nr:Uncharacterised protein [Bordetella pertussis]